VPSGGKRSNAGRKTKAEELGIHEGRAKLVKVLGSVGNTLKQVAAYDARLHEAYLVGLVDSVTFRDLEKASANRAHKLLRERELDQRAKADKHRVQAEERRYELALSKDSVDANLEQMLADAKALVERQAKLLKALGHGAEPTGEDQGGASPAPVADESAGPDVGSASGVAAGTERQSTAGGAPAPDVRRAV
jgi:hypothetical protein